MYVNDGYPSKHENHWKTMKIVKNSEKCRKMPKSAKKPEKCRKTRKNPKKAVFWRFWHFPKKCALFFLRFSRNFRKKRSKSRPKSFFGHFRGLAIGAFFEQFFRPKKKIGEKKGSKSEIPPRPRKIVRKVQKKRIWLGGYTALLGLLS